MSRRAAIDRAVHRLGLSALVPASMSDRDVHSMWVQIVGRHATLLHLRVWMGQRLPGVDVDSLLSHAEQTSLFATLQAWDKHFA